MNAKEARELAESALRSQDETTLNNILDQIKESAVRGCLSCSPKFHISRYIEESLEELGYKVKWKESADDRYYLIEW